MAAEENRPRIMVIGIGNAYRGDAVVGLIVARRVREERLRNMTVLEESGEGTVLMDAWKDADRVILIDAVHSQAEPGTIHRLDARAQPILAGFFRYSTHAFGVAEAVGLARALDRLPPSLIVYGIEGKNYQAGGPLSPEVEAAVRQVVERVCRDIQESRSLMPV
jgi:hydrogenase maturation protease